MNDLKTPEIGNKSSEKAGLPPGSLVYIGGKTDKVKINVIEYDGAQFQEKEAKDIEDCLPIKNPPTVTWINVEGVHQADIIEQIGKHFKIHPLVLEDIMNTEQRPKLEDFEDYIFIVLKKLRWDEEIKGTVAEQVSLILGPNFVISLQEKGPNIFDPIKERIKGGKGRSKKTGADYLANSLIDVIVDNYFVILEKFGEKIEILEDELIKNPTPNNLQSIYNLKRELIFLRKTIWPLVEVVGCMQKADMSLISETTMIYLRDIYDHIMRIIETIETYRDTVSGMLDVYLSSISNKTNDVVKVLTIITTIFIPLSFIAAVYGMNFQNMPELGWQYGYPFIWFTMGFIGISMLVYFKRKKWM